MDVLLSKDLENFVSEQVKRGNYLSTDEVIGEALLLLKREEQLREIQREELRKEIQKGIDQIKAGQSTTYTSGEALAEEVISRGKQRLADKEKKKNG
jgi:putative addiction module CopG family antidote